ncbi:hypothetical protein [Chryseobacterium taeanense]|uniref:hypothetical protein n=1 Tax=Chryseobacterium taeanense TaxID=311334 RepID=UPI0035AF2C09
MKTTPTLLLVFLLLIQFSFAQKNNWTAIDKSYSIRTLAEKNTDNVKDSDPVSVEIYSFPRIIDDIDIEKEKSSTSKNLTFKDIHGKIGNKNNLILKKNSTYLIKLQEGIRGGRFRLEINKNADPKAIENLNKYLTEKITHGSILQEAIDTAERKNITTSFIIAVTTDDHFDFDILKKKFNNIIIDISKVATNRNTIFFKVTT